MLHRIKVKLGLCTQSDQLVTPQKVHFVKVQSLLSPESATIPTPVLFRNSHSSKLPLEMGPTSASISTPAPGGEKTAAFPVWLKAHLFTVKPLPPIQDSPCRPLYSNFESVIST